MFKNNNILDLVIGILMTITGFYIWFHPLDTLILVALYLGIIFILAGGAYLVEYFRRRHNKYLTYGLINLVVGAILVSNGALVATSLSIIFALWILFSSIVQLITSVKFKQLNISFWIYPLISGALGLIFSFIILHNPSTGVLTIAIIIGTYMIMYGSIEVSEYFLLQDIDNK